MLTPAQRRSTGVEYLKFQGHLTPVMVLLLFILSSGNSQTSGSFPFPSEQPEVYDPAALSHDSLTNTLINIPWGGFRLEGGKYSFDTLDSEGWRHYLFVGLTGFISVDLDGDGNKDAIGSLSVNTGGSGIFNSLDIFLNRRGSAFHMDSYLIGDREEIDSVRIIGSILNVFLRVHGPNEPMCCPTMTELRRLQIVNEKIIEVQ